MALPTDDQVKDYKQIYIFDNQTVYTKPEVSKEEAKATVAQLNKKYSVKYKPDAYIFNPDGEYMDTHAFHEVHPPFERTRRITGYLVGTTDRWNDAKLAELSERVKHSVGNY